MKEFPPRLSVQSGSLDEKCRPGSWHLLESAEPLSPFPVSSKCHQRPSIFIILILMDIIMTSSSSSSSSWTSSSSITHSLAETGSTKKLPILPILPILSILPILHLNVSLTKLRSQVLILHSDATAQLDVREPVKFKDVAVENGASLSRVSNS